MTRVVEWFGFKLHLLVDVKHEVPLAYKITHTKAGDGEMLPEILVEAQANLPPGRIQTLAYDKAADTNEVHQVLSRDPFKAVIQNRSLWKEDPERMLPGHDGNANIVYDEAGTVYCYERVSSPLGRHQMSCIGDEPERETIKYRCPASAMPARVTVARFAFPGPSIYAASRLCLVPRRISRNCSSTKDAVAVSRREGAHTNGLDLEQKPLVIAVDQDQRIPGTGWRGEPSC